MKLQGLGLCLLFNLMLNANEFDPVGDGLNDQDLIESATKLIEPEDIFVPEIKSDANMPELAPAYELPQEGSEEQAAEELVHMPDSLNTLGSDDSGNWVLKRVWWEKSERAFDKILKLNLQISNLQTDYFSARNQIDKQLDADKRSLALTLTEIDQLVNYLLKNIEQEGVAALDKNNFAQIILLNKDKIILLKEYIAQLAKLDSDMDDVIINVITQVQKCNDYEVQSWQIFKQIGRMLNDLNAKEEYYKIVNYRKNIKSINNYLKIDLKESFDKMATYSINKIENIKQIVTQLHQAGIDMVYEFKNMNEGVSYSDQVQTNQEEEPAPVRKNQKNSFITNILNFIKMLVNFLLWLPRKLFGLIGIKF